jgi:hypothetical protein
MQNDDLRNRPPWSICVAATLRSDVYHMLSPQFRIVSPNWRPSSGSETRPYFGRAESLKGGIGKFAQVGTELAKQSITGFKP